MKMKFNYRDYFTCTLVQALILFFVAIIVSVLLLLSLVKSFNFEKLLGVIIIAVFLTVSISWLKYGIYLLKEKEDAAQIMIGGDSKNPKSLSITKIL